MGKLKLGSKCSLDFAQSSRFQAAFPHRRQNLWRKIHSSLPLGRGEPWIKPGKLRNVC